MAKKLAAILLCVVLISVGVLALGHLTRPLGDDVAIANVENFHKLPENSIDVIVYGSSHAWRNVNVNEMYDKYGIGAYNYAANWQHLAVCPRLAGDPDAQGGADRGHAHQQQRV